MSAKVDGDHPMVEERVLVAVNATMGHVINGVYYWCGPVDVGVLTEELEADRPWTGAWWTSLRSGATAWPVEAAVAACLLHGDWPWFARVVVHRVVVLGDVGTQLRRTEGEDR